MNRALCILCSFILIFTWAENGSKGKNQQSAASLIISETREKDSNGEDETMNYDKKGNTGKLMQLTTQKGNSIIFQLNDSSAANALYDQLPLTIETDNYGGMKKSFIPQRSWMSAILLWQKVLQVHCPIMSLGVMWQYFMGNAVEAVVYMSWEKRFPELNIFHRLLVKLS